MDLNSDVVLDLDEEGVVDKVDDMGRELVEDGMNGGLEEKGELVDGVDEAEVKIGYLDRDIEEKRSVVSSRAVVDGGKGGAEGREGLEGHQFCDGDGIAAKGEEVNAVDGDDSMSFEAKRNVEVDGGDDLMRDEKEVEVAQVAEIGSGERGRDQNVEQGQLEEEILNASISMRENVVQECLGTTGSDVEVKVVNHNECLHHQELNVSTKSEIVTCDGLENQALEVSVEAQTNENKATCDNVPETGVSQNTENGLNMLNNVIDLIPSMITDGNVSSNGDGNSEPEFHDSDLVWGKVMSHPWWPGQICDPSASSQKAKKHFKKGTYLIAYFWDNTFAWNEEPKIKPFLEHFSQMEKQSNMEEFQDAIACALDEVSRRVELGLTCSCISKDVYAKLKTQIIINSGIREEASRRDGGDNSLSVTSFEPVKLIRFIKELAQLPFSRVDRLELVTSRARISAFYRWKGYPQLPEFNILGGLLENDADISLLGEKHCGEVSEIALPVVKDEELVRESKSKDNSSCKRKHISGDNSQPSKKEKSLSRVAAEKYISNPMSENGSERKASCKLISQSSSKKRKAVDVLAGESAVKHRSNDSSAGADCNSMQNKQTFRVGDRICRVASQLNGSSPILKNYSTTSREDGEENKGKEKVISEKPQTQKLVESEYPSPDEMLSQLSLIATSPMDGDSSISMITCFSEFRNTICLDRPSPEEHQLSLEQMFGKLGKKSRSGKKSVSSGISEKSGPQAIRHDQASLESQNESGELAPGAPTDKDTSAVEPQANLELNPNLDSQQKIAGEDLESETVKPTSHSSESCEEDLSPTALIFKFTDVESVPSEANLTKIFSCYGPLIEVLRKKSRATVVYKKRSDAETAFSSTGKYSTFGPSLVSYSLKYMRPTPSKAAPSPGSTKRGRKAATSREGSATS